MCGILLEAEQEGLYFLNNVPSFFMFWPRRSGANASFCPLAQQGGKRLFWDTNPSGPRGATTFCPLAAQGGKMGEPLNPPKSALLPAPEGEMGAPGGPPLGL